MDAGNEIILHNWRMPLRNRLEKRVFTGPYRWRVPTLGRSDGRGYYAADDKGTPDDSTFRLRAVDQPRRYRGGWCGSPDSEPVYPVVLRLPKGRGFLAGWTYGEGMASSIEHYIFDNEEDAWGDATNQARAQSEADGEHDDAGNTEEGE